MNLADRKAGKPEQEINDFRFCITEAAERIPERPLHYILSKLKSLCGCGNLSV
jgi:hypothetical protein